MVTIWPANWIDCEWSLTWHSFWLTIALCKDSGVDKACNVDGGNNFDNWPKISV